MVARRAGARAGVAVCRATSTSIGRPPSEKLAGKVLVPILGDQYGAVLERGEIALRFAPEAGELSLWYYEHRLPIRPAEYPRVLLANAAPRFRSVPPMHFAASRDRFAAVPMQRRSEARTRRRCGAAAKAALAELCATAHRGRTPSSRKTCGHQRQSRATRAASMRCTR